MAKDDPAFLFYPKDWLSGTTDMSIQEKGVYIDLLAHQHQSGGLPTDINRLARMVHLSKDEFLVIWEYLKVKFVEKDGVLQNRKLVKVISARSEHAESRTIIGTFGALMRELKASESAKYYIRKKFLYKDFIETYNQNKDLLYDLLSKWVSKCLATYVIEIENGIENGINNKESSEKNKNSDNCFDNPKAAEQTICGDMVKAFKNTHKSYFSVGETDIPATLKIACYIAEAKGWEERTITKERKEDILTIWDKVIDFTKEHSLYSNFSISDLQKKWSGVTQSMAKAKKPNEDKPKRMVI